MINQVIEEFFIKYQTEQLKWFEEMKLKMKNMQWKDWYEFSVSNISKGNRDLIENRRCYIKDKIQTITTIEEIIHEDMRIKKIKLYQKISDKVGTVSAVNLYCGEDGSMNGTVKGDKGKVNITTIIAGGYNIQCIHYRVLVK